MNENLLQGDDACRELYEFTVEDRDEYVYACVMAPYMNLKIATDYSNELGTHLRKTAHKRVLFVRETPGMGSESHYSIVASLIANMLPRHIALAVVDRSPVHEFVKRWILEERERKNKNINAFDTFDEAEAWLLSQPA